MYGQKIEIHLIYVKPPRGDKARIKMPKGIPKDKSVKRRIIHQLKIAKGHLDSVIRMVENDEYCIDIIYQSKAVQSALKNADREILRNHMETCVAKSMGEGKIKDVVSEVMEVIKRS